MNKQAPSARQLLTMLAFAGSCVGLLLFLWLSFGGTIPLAARGYRLNAEFDAAVELGTQSDVRISGVSVGKVVSVSLDTHTGLTKAVMQLSSQYAPRPADTRAILRQKSLLGEAYIELSPGTRRTRNLPDGATLPQSAIAPSVQLDQILSTFDPVTRQAYMTWQQQDGIALTNRGLAFNDAIAQLYPFATNVDAVLAVLRRDGSATSTLLRDGGAVFSALGRSPAALGSFVRNSNALFAATAAQNANLAATIKAFPGFLMATRLTVDRLNRFAITTRPLIDELRPAATPLSQALAASVPLAPELRRVLIEVGPLTHLSTTGVPALIRFLDLSEPWLTRLKPYLGQLVPVIDYINTFRRELAAFFANSTAVTQAASFNLTQTKFLHYLRIANPVNPEVLTAYQHRLESNRGNPYPVPGWFNTLASGLTVFDGGLCTSNPQPAINPALSAQTIADLKLAYYTATPGGPPCRAQAPLGAATGQLGSFPHLQPLR
jgi:phospholipid/cholesterol/gamma-HCH transport system substrate-binding protein